MKTAGGRQFPFLSHAAENATTHASALRKMGSVGGHSSLNIKKKNPSENPKSKKEKLEMILAHKER